MIRPGIRSFQCLLISCSFAAVFVLAAAPAGAASGALDPTFAGDGTEAYSGMSGANDVLLQDDGKMIVAGSAAATISYDMVLVRFLYDGSVDKQFGVRGTAQAGFPNYGSASSVGVQADSKLIAAGTVRQLDDNGMDIGLARFGPKGALDPSYGQAGRVRLDITDYDSASDMLVQPDSRAVIAGGAIDVSSGEAVSSVVLARFTTAGALDPTFGDGGVRRIDLPGIVNERFESVAIQPDGKLVAAGWGHIGPDDFDYGWIVMRFTAAGSPDPTFGSGGVVVTNPGSNWDEAQSVLVQPNGRIVVAGYTTISPGYKDAAIARYLPDGALDPSFGGGLVRLDVSVDDEGFALAQQPDGKTYLGGTTSLNVRDGGGFDFLIARYTSDGTLDPGFGTSGIVVTDAGASRDDTVQALAQFKDGRLVAVGDAVEFDPRGSAYEAAFARYLNPVPGPECTITGTTGDDAINGTAGDDVICGLGGDDTIDAKGGNDIIFGGLGNDLIRSGDGDDTAYGEGGNDQIIGGGGADYLSGDAGADVLTGQDRVSGNDRLAGGAGNDACSGDPGDQLQSCNP